MPSKPFDEYEIGDTFESYSRTVTETDIVNFTCLAGLKLPIFIDEEFAKKHTPFGTRIAPSFLICSIASGMMEDIAGKYTIANVGLDGIRFHVPVKAGDTLHIRVTVKAKKETSKPDRGVLTYLTEIINQRGEVAAQFTSSNLTRRLQA